MYIFCGVGLQDFYFLSLVWMFHMFCGEAKKLGEQVYLVNDMFGIEVVYQGTLRKGEFFLFPYMDDTQKTIRYFAFDTYDQKHLFLTLFKINGI